MENQFNKPQKSHEAFTRPNTVDTIAHQTGKENLPRESTILSQEINAKLHSQEQAIEYTPETISDMLKNRIDAETIPHFKSVIQRASQSFESGIIAETSAKRKESIGSMIQAENYLGEKYRDTKDQRAYIEALNKGIEYLESI